MSASCHSAYDMQEWNDHYETGCTDINFKLILER